MSFAAVNRNFIQGEKSDQFNNNITVKLSKNHYFVFILFQFKIEKWLKWKNNSLDKTSYIQQSSPSVGMELPKWRNRAPQAVEWSSSSGGIELPKWRNGASQVGKWSSPSRGMELPKWRDGAPPVQGWSSPSGGLGRLERLLLTLPSPNPRVTITTKQSKR